MHLVVLLISCKFLLFTTHVNQNKGGGGVSARTILVRVLTPKRHWKQSQSFYYSAPAPSNLKYLVFSYTTV